MANLKPWIGVDLDDTLAVYNKKDFNQNIIGTPIQPMVDRVKQWLKDGREVKIFTARISVIQGEQLEACIRAIQDWCLKHIGRVLPITCYKDYGMTQLWDDRAVQVIPGTGITAAGQAYENGYAEGYAAAARDAQNGRVD